MLRAISTSSIGRAVSEWKKKFRVGATVYSWRGLPVYYLKDHGIWGHFGKREDSTGLKYGNIFGTGTGHFNDSRVVEINPPRSSNYTNVVGHVAEDARGQRWLVHRGHLHLAQRNITAEHFAKATRLDGETIVLPSGAAAKYTYYRVANIDADAATVQLQTAMFIRECATIRKMYESGARSASETQCVDLNTDELTGNYFVPGRPGGMATRLHGDVYEALKRKLRELGHNPRRTRMRAFTLDLRTDEHVFELKSKADAASIQQALGQLLLYEKLLGHPHTKVLVIPMRCENFSDLLQTLKIQVLTYSGSGKNVTFDSQALFDLGSRKQALRRP